MGEPSRRQPYEGPVCPLDRRPAVGVIAVSSVPDYTQFAAAPTLGIMPLCSYHWTTPPFEWRSDSSATEGQRGG